MKNLKVSGRVDFTEEESSARELKEHSRRAHAAKMKNLFLGAEDDLEEEGE